jgi:ABC-type multidrug transport system fused ATPase/permease subunit
MSTPNQLPVPRSWAITRVKTNLPNSLISTEVSCWILTGERQTAVIRSKYVQVLLNQDMSFFDTYGNNGDIVSQVLSDVLLIQSALSEKVRSIHA